MRFLGNVLAVIVGLLIFSVMRFFILAGILAVISSSEDEVDIKENTVQTKRYTDHNEGARSDRPLFKSKKGFIHTRGPDTW